jgi:1,4-dihydroxy-2-naphthoate octaprenyltransferase
VGAALAAGALTNPISIWWRAVRPFSLSASVTPVLVGSAAAFDDGAFHPGLFAATLVASMAIHAATNLVNDYYDNVRGVDATQPIGPGGAIQQGTLSTRAVLNGALVLFALSGVIGIWLIVLRGWPVLLIGVLSVLAGYTYTGGPVPLGYVGLGDLTVFVFMGLAIVCGAYYVQTGTISASVVWAAIPIAALVDGILVANNLRDFENDRAKGKRTFAVLIGRGATRLHYLVLSAVAYLSVILGVAVGALPVLTLLVLLTAPAAVQVWRVVRTERDPGQLTIGAIRETARLHMRVGLLLSLGFVLSAFIRLP